MFTKKYEKLSYKLTIIGPRLLKDPVVQGSLWWINDGGKYVVRSPIVATNLVMPRPEMSTIASSPRLRIHMGPQMEISGGTVCLCFCRVFMVLMLPIELHFVGDSFPLSWFASMYFFVLSWQGFGLVPIVMFFCSCFNKF